MRERAEGLRAVVASLCGLDRDFDADRIAEILWLAAQDDGSVAESDDAERREDPDDTPATADGPPTDDLAAEADQPTRRSSLHTP
ncbi:hypothetical protein, partial [Streptomyces anulatus]